LRRPPLYPLLFAAVPTLEIAARNPGQYRPSDLAAVLAAVVILAALALAGAAALVRTVGRSDRTPLLAGALAMLAVAWCFYYVPTQQALSALSHRLARGRVLFPLGALLTLGVIAWLARQPRDRLDRLTGFMTRFGLLLLAMVVSRAAIAQARGPLVVRRSALARELAVPLRAADTLPPRNRPARDIYLLVLDGHANGQVLREVFGFDNSRFEDSLRALGFLVPRDVRSNYVQTYLSVSSLLNAAQVTRLAQDAGVTSKDHSLPTYLVKHNRVARFLKDRGYRYLLFPSAWWAATSSSPLADETFVPEPGLHLAREARRTELRITVLRSTLLRRAFGRDSAETPVSRHILRSFDGLREVPHDPAPTFAFAHMLAPHIPYIFDADCRHLAREIPDYLEADTPEQRAAYIAQVRCVDRLVLDLVTTVLRRSSTPPVILVVGDHGPRFSDVGFYGHAERVSAAFVRERFGAFGAFYLPGGGDTLFGQPVTLVNVMGNVLRYYFGADLPPSADSMFVSGEQLYRFHPVDPRLLQRAEK
jgi:hypothetical protein